MRLPKLDDERFSVVVLGEFNHGKSTFINALLGAAGAADGHHADDGAAGARHARRARDRDAVGEDGRAAAIAGAALADWLTVDGQARTGQGGRQGDGQGDGRAPSTTSRSTHPSPLLENQLTIVDTPGVNDINEQRADITYGYLPRADAAVFLLDATQILTASERQFLEERILRSTRDRLLFVVAKADLLDEAELAETLPSRASTWRRSSPEPAIFPVSAKRALAGDRAGSGLDAFVAALGATVANERRRLLLDNALADATPAVGLHPPEPGHPPPVAGAAAARAGGADRARAGAAALGEEGAGDGGRDGARRDRGAEGARAPGPGRFHRRAARRRWPPTSTPSTPPTSARTCRSSCRTPGRPGPRRRASGSPPSWSGWPRQVIQVANENIREVAGGVAERSRARRETKVEIKVDTLKYDASVFALGALGTTVFLFVNTLVGGVLALAAPVLAMVLRGRVATEVKAEAKEQGPLAIDRVAALVGPKLDEIIDGFGARLLEFVSQAGDALTRGIADVLDQALRERRAADDEHAATADVKQHRRRDREPARDRRADRRDPPAGLDARGAARPCAGGARP